MTVQDGNSLGKIAELIKLAMGDEVPAEAIGEQTRFTEDLGMQSINRLMLLSLLEQECGINLESHMAQLVELETVGDTMRLLDKLKGGH
ncbi:acyl carrier protein [Luteibacter jiangsuensis]